jgi:hypothetical protein
MNEAIPTARLQHLRRSRLPGALRAALGAALGAALRAALPAGLPVMLACVAFAALAASAAAPLHAQDEPPALQRLPAPADGLDWDSPRALDLMEQARLRRLLPQQDTTLRNYSAKAEGFVYFYLDRRDTEERTLVKVDQVALEVHWAPPDRTRQHIVGMRDVSRLPNRMYYHLDHLTVVQDGFGDVIRMGDGDEVADVPHPAATGSDSIYEFRLADSLTLRLPGMPEPIRVYEIEVRPRRLDRSALVGSVFVDRARGDIVRMTFTFTPASYVDRRLDYILVSLDNGLWEGRYWLPHEQTLQIRRQVPELDFAAGAVIHGRMRISDYVFNDSLQSPMFYALPLTAAPHAERVRYPFERGIFDDLNEAGLAPPAELAQLRQQAAALLGSARLSGLPRWRLSVGSVSSALRYNRAEGMAVGLGASYVPARPWRGDVYVGYATGPGQPLGHVVVRRERAGSGATTLRLSYREAHDVSISPGVPGAINTLSSMFMARDYLDLHQATGARLAVRLPLGGGLLGSAEVAAERHANVELTQSTAPFSDGARFREVAAMDAGRLASISAGIQRPAAHAGAWTWGGSARLEAGMFGGSAYVRPVIDAAVGRASADHARAVRFAGAAGLVSAAAPAQRLFLLGGAGTLPGYIYRGFSGTRFGLARLEASGAVMEPWLRVRAVAAAGAAGGLPAPGGAAAGWMSGPTNGLRTSAGAGVSLLWDMLRIDAVRGLNGGEWQLLLSFHPGFLDIS